MGCRCRCCCPGSVRRCSRSPARSRPARSPGWWAHARCANTSCPGLERRPQRQAGPPPGSSANVHSRRPAPALVVELPRPPTGDTAAARELAGRMFKTYATLPAYRAMLDREGVAGPAEVAVVGDHDAIGEQLLRLAEAGATDFNAAPISLGEHDAGLDECLRSLVRIGAEIAPRQPLASERRA